jgi:hypothetical protein
MSSGVGWVEAEGTEGKAQKAGRSSPREKERLEVRARVVVKRPLERGEERRQGRLMEMSKRSKGRRTPRRVADEPKQRGHSDARRMTSTLRGPFTGDPGNGVLWT